MRIFSILFITGLILASPASLACTAFCLAGRGQVVVGKTYDWLMGHGTVFVYPRGTPRQTLVFDATPNPANWTSKYGSVSMTQFGQGISLSGMNEKGLVVEILESDSADYGSVPPGAPYTNEGQWAQYQLDNFASVQEVVRNVNSLRIQKAFIGVHYFITDASGQSAAVDFVQGKAQVRYGSTLPIPALTNDPYDQLLDYSSKNPGPVHPGIEGLVSGTRFLLARETIRQAAQTPDNQLVALAWKGLQEASVNGTAFDALGYFSQWQIVYDVTHRTIFFQTLASSQIKRLDLSQLDFSPRADVKMVDMNLNMSGDLAPLLHDYNADENEALIRQNTLLMAVSFQLDKINTAITAGHVQLYWLALKKKQLGGQN